MAGLTDFAMSPIVGWVVGGVTALVGILVAHHYQEKSRLDREDRVGIFEPLRRNMADILDNGEWRTAKGDIAWAGSAEPSDMLKRGALNPHRLRFLRRDVSRLIELGDAHVKAWTRFYDARQAEKEAAAKVKPARDEYASSAKALISHAGIVAGRLDAALGARWRFAYGEK